MVCKFRKPRSIDLCILSSVENDTLNCLLLFSQKENRITVRAMAERLGLPHLRKKISQALDSLNEKGLIHLQKRGHGRAAHYCVEFSDEIQENINCQAQTGRWQLFDFDDLLAIPSGRTRFLFEYLESRKNLAYCNGIWKESADKIATRIGVGCQQGFKRNQRIKQIAEALVQAGYLARYEKTPNHVCCFIFSDNWGKQCDFTDKNTSVRLLNF